ncbi:hypothetical protein FKW77_001439 [Venturia effusa]|uniref:Uncharacterized protein n=1 Tax=Venturia effusa TaxID=50376 RepID=A0A517L6Q1_9PEZI|nr:hypothetical protein FKW77_001439 [Venturia effusa]
MPQDSKGWSLRGNLKKWWTGRKVKKNNDSMYHQGQSNTNHNYTSAPFDDTSTISQQASTMTIESDFRTAALQPSISMIPNLQHAPYARSTHLAFEHFDSATTPCPQTIRLYRDHDSTKRTDCYDSGHSASCNSSQQSETKVQVEGQQTKHEIPVEVPSGTPFAEESAHLAQDLHDTHVCEDAAKVPEDGSLSTIGVPLSSSDSSLETDTPDNATRIHAFQSSEPSRPLMIKNLNDLEGTEYAGHAEHSIIEAGSSAISRSTSQSTSASPTSFRRSVADEKFPSTALRRYRGHTSRISQLPAREAKIFCERRREIQQFMEEEGRRASLDPTLGPGLYQLPSKSAPSLRNFHGQASIHRQQSTSTLPDCQGPTSCTTKPGTSLESREDPSSLDHADVRHAQSMQDLCSRGMSQAYHDVQYSQSMTDQLRCQIPNRGAYRAPSDTRSISSRSFVDASDQASFQSRLSRTPSVVSSLYNAQQRPFPDPSPRHLRYPGGPTPVDARNHTAMHSHSSGSDPYSRPFTGFSGDYTQSQRPQSTIYHATTAGCQSEYQFLNHDADASLAGYPHHRLGHVYSRSTPDFGGRPASIASTSTTISAVGHTHGPNPMPYVPPTGPLMTDVMTPSAPPRGQRRNPKEIPALPCAANVNMAVSWDANGEPIGYHYENPEVSAIKRWQGGVHAVEELKRQRRGKTLSNYSTRTTFPDAANYQKQIASRRAQVYRPPNCAPQRLGQLGLQYSHIEQRKARREEQLEEQARQQAEQEKKEEEERARERQMKSLKEEVRKEVILEMNMAFEVGETGQRKDRGGGVVVGQDVAERRSGSRVGEEGDGTSVPGRMPTMKKRLSGFWGKKGRE